MIFSRFFNNTSLVTASNALTCAAQTTCAVVRVGFKAIKYIWGAFGLKTIAAPFVEPITDAVLDLYETNTVLVKTTLGKIDQNSCVQDKLDEMAKDQTPTEIAMITSLMLIQLSLSLAVVPFFLVAKLFTAPKVEAAW